MVKNVILIILLNLFNYIGREKSQKVLSSKNNYVQKLVSKKEIFVVSFREDAHKNQ
jgi:hypothetical protein